MKKLPPKKWITLPEALQLLVDEGFDEVSIKADLPKAFENIEVLTRGIAKSYTGYDGKNNLSGHHWVTAEIIWEKNIAALPTRRGLFGGDLSGGKHLLEDIEVSRQSLLKWVGLWGDDDEESSEVINTRDNQGTVLKSGQSEDGPLKEKRVRKSTRDWEAFYVQVVVYAYIKELPVLQADFERIMLVWCQENWGREPSISSIKTKLSPIYTHSWKTSRGDKI